MKHVNNQNLWTFEIRSQEEVKVPIWIFVGFQQRVRQNSQNPKDDTFCRLPVTDALCKIGLKNAMMLAYC